MAGALVHKYGHVIGMTGAPVRAGEHVHTHSLTMPPSATEVASGPAAAVPDVPAVAGQQGGRQYTILEKSLGSVAKGGRSPLAEIVDYAVVPTAKGFVSTSPPSS